jgi:hypothetical protein
LNAPLLSFEDISEERRERRRSCFISKIFRLILRRRQIHDAIPTTVVVIPARISQCVCSSYHAGS